MAALGLIKVGRQPRGWTTGTLVPVHAKPAIRRSRSPRGRFHLLLTRVAIAAGLCAPVVVLLLSMFGMNSWGDEAFYAMGCYHHFFDGLPLYSESNPMVYPPLAFVAWLPAEWIAGPKLLALRGQAVIFSLALLMMMYDVARRFGAPTSTRVSLAGVVSVLVFLASRSVVPMFATATPYCVTGFLILLLYRILAPDWQSPRRLTVAASVLAALLATRHNVGGCVVLGMLWLLTHHPRRWQMAAWCGGVTLAAYAAILLPFWPDMGHIWPNPPWMAAPPADVPFSRPGLEPGEGLAITKRFIRSFLPVVIGAAASLAAFAFLRKSAIPTTDDSRCADSVGPLRQSMIVTAVSLFAVHLIGPFAFAPSLINTYILYSYPLFCLLFGASISWFVASETDRRHRFLALCAIGCVTLGALLGRLPTKWHGIFRPFPLASISRTARWIATYTDPNDRLYAVTWARPHPIFEADRHTFPLLENAPFSYTPKTDAVPLYGYFNEAIARRWLADESNACLVWQDALDAWRHAVPTISSMIEQELSEHFFLEAEHYHAWPSGRLSLYRRKPIDEAQTSAMRRLRPHDFVQAPP